MAAYAAFQAHAVDANQRVIPAAYVEVIDEATSNLATIYSTRAGAALDNPFVAAADGYFRFYAAGGRYRIRFYKNGQVSTEWRDVPIGTAAEYDIENVLSAGVPDGTVGAPGLFWGSDPDTGFYRIGANNLGIAVGGVKQLDIADGVTQINGNFRPISNAGGSLGVAGVGFSAAYLSASAPINWGNGALTLTPSGTNLSLSPLSVLTAVSTAAFCPQINLWNAAADATGAFYILRKTRATTGTTAAQVADNGGSFQWAAADSGNAVRNVFGISTTISAVGSGTGAVGGNFFFQTFYSGVANSGQVFSIIGTTGQIQFVPNIAATSTTTGSLIVTGGVGISADLWIGGGLIVGAATGGDKGDGTANFAGDIYKNNTAYTNPDYAFEHFYSGKIVRFAKHDGAATYRGLKPLAELRDYTRSHLRLPGISDDPMGAFKRSDIALEKIEEAHLYIMELHDRVAALEARH